MNYLSKTIEYGIYLLAFFLTIQTRLILRSGELSGGYFEYGTVSLYAVDILLIIVFFLYLSSRAHARDLVRRVCRDFSSPGSGPGLKALVRNDKKQFSIFNFQFSIKEVDYKFFLVLFALAAFVSIFFAQDKISASYVFIRLLLGIGLFWLLVRAEYDKMKLAYFFLAGIFLQACLGIWQFIYQASFASKWLGLAEHNPMELGVSVIEFADERWLRAYGGLDHPNILGGVMVVGLLILLMYWIKIPITKKQETNKFQISRLASASDSESRLANSKIQGLSSRTIVRDLVMRFYRDFSSHPLVRNDKDDILQILKIFTFYLLLVTFFPALFFSFSRNAWLGFVFGWMVLFFISIKNTQRKKFLEISAAISVLAVMFFYLYSDLVKTRIFPDSRLENISIEERIGGYKIFKDVIKENWLFGAGAGNYAFAVRGQIADKPSYFYQPIHNSFALMWAEIGIFGILSFLGFIGLLLYSGFKKKGAYLLLFLPVLFMMFNEHWWWSLHFGILFSWFLIGCFFRFSES